MQIEKIGEYSGKVTSRRVLSNPGGGPKMETTQQLTGTLLGVEASETCTYSSVMRPDGTLFGEGLAIVMSNNGDIATWVANGVGTVGKDGATTFRGALYYQTSSVNWSRLNSVAAIFDYRVEADGACSYTLWECV